MAKPTALNLHPPEYERFLHASVGEDRNGYVVTVFSTLARLGLDPWKETAILVTMGRDAAQARLETLLSRFLDVPALADDHCRVARDLSRLLPLAQDSGSLKQNTWTDARARFGKTGAIWAVLAVMYALYQMFTVGGLGSGE